MGHNGDSRPILRTTSYCFPCLLQYDGDPTRPPTSPSLNWFSVGGTATVTTTGQCRSRRQSVVSFTRSSFPRQVHMPKRGARFPGPLERHSGKDRLSGQPFRPKRTPQTSRPRHPSGCPSLEGKLGKRRSATHLVKGPQQNIRVALEPHPLHEDRPNGSESERTTSGEETLQWVGGLKLRSKGTVEVSRSGPERRLKVGPQRPVEKV